MFSLPHLTCIFLLYQVFLITDTICWQWRYIARTADTSSLHTTATYIPSVSLIAVPTSPGGIQRRNNKSLPPHRADDTIVLRCTPCGKQLCTLIVLPTMGIIQLCRAIF